MQLLSFAIRIARKRHIVFADSSYAFMMSHFKIRGGKPLSGSIRPRGNKNAALPLIAAALLSDEPLTLHNVPDIGDVRTKLRLIRGLGAQVEFDGHKCVIDASGLKNQTPDAELSSQIRTSVLLAAPMLVRFKRTLLARPGGDRIGRRNLDTHLSALRAFGAIVDVKGSTFVLSTKGLQGADLFLEEMSVTGTEQAILCAVLSPGTTRISQAATEPHVQDLCRCLVAMGARISGIGTHTVTIIGVTALSRAEFTVSPDYMEVGSFIALAAATRSTIRIVDAQPENQRITQAAFGRLGVNWEVDGEDILIADSQDLRMDSDFDGATPKIADLPWPGFPPDLISIAVVLATQCRGSVLISQRLFDRRLVFVDRLIAMGAGIVQCDPHRVVVIGPRRLRGISLSSPDIRAGMAMVIAALAAEGETTIHNVTQVDRGYERLERRLAALGADIQRCSGG